MEVDGALPLLLLLSAVYVEEAADDVDGADDFESFWAALLVDAGALLVEEVGRLKI